MGVEQEVNHQRIVANQETGGVLLGCRSKSTEAEPRDARLQSLQGLKIEGDNIRAADSNTTRLHVKNEGI